MSVWKQWSLKTSVSSISIPELPTSGDNCEPIANKLVDNTKDGCLDEYQEHSDARSVSVWSPEDLRVEHGGQHQLFVGTKACPTKSNGHRITGGIL